jgi:hypothetical protein
MRPLSNRETWRGGGCRLTARCFAALAAGLCLCILFPCTSGAAVGSAAWHLIVTAQPTNLVPGATGPQGFLVVATNVGGGDTDGEITMTDVLPTNLLPARQEEECKSLGRRITCSFNGVVHSGESIVIFLPAMVSGAPGAPRPNVTTIVGGGAEGAKATSETEVGASPPAFGVLDGPSGLSGVLNDSEGVPVTQAGATPFELVMDLGFPTEMVGSELVGAGQPKDVAVDLPPGLSLDPAAVPRCRQAQLEHDACPPASQVGVVGLAIELGSIAFENIPLYNVVPPPGSASDFGFAVVEGATVDLLGSVRAGEYGLSANAAELVAVHPVLGIQLQFWGDPSDSSHDAVRGVAVEPLNRPLISLPSACGPLELGARTDSWEAPGAFISRSVPIESRAGGGLEVEGCSGLAFESALSVQPTTAVADSRAGLRLNLKVPQQLGPQGSTTSSLRHVAATLPPGMVINAAAAGGATVCSPAQVGLVSAVGEATARFDGAPTTCPDASKLGTVEALTPLLQDESGEGTPRPHPLTGAIYLAEPHQNPFGSLFALYAVIEDPETGILVKLAGEVVADPVTGQLTTTFDELPQLPFEEFKLDFFEGARAPLRTPAVCGSYLSRGVMSPWSGTAPVGTESEFSIASSPSGGSCATVPGQLPNSPHFDAGTVSPGAGRYSPFVLNISRADGSQEFGALNVTLAAGLSGRFAGTSLCPDADLTGGTSCPVASRIGHVAVDLGAGSSPYRAEGTVYLAGPYHGAPLSLAVVTPAVAGPFDLGTVVVRAAVSVDPSTGQISVKSDRLPTILDGVPLDIRSLQLELDKPELIRNPTSCEPGTVSAEAVSTLGQVAPLSSRFQVGNCAALPFKPKLALKLSGARGRNGHPALRATLHADVSGATLKSASFTLPGGELLDLHHVRDLCSRGAPVGQCPSRSRLGSIRLSSPSLEAPLQGAVYLRAPSRRLPDLSAELRSEGLSFVLSGRTTDSGGRLGVSLESLPDIPFSSAVLTLSGGRRGILVNSHSLCGKRGYVAANFSAHNGMRRGLRVPVRVAGCH